MTSRLSRVAVVGEKRGQAKEISQGRKRRRTWAAPDIDLVLPKNTFPFSVLLIRENNESKASNHINTGEVTTPFDFPICTPDVVLFPFLIVSAIKTGKWRGRQNKQVVR